MSDQIQPRNGGVGERKGTPVFCDKNAWEADHIAVSATSSAPGFRWRNRKRAVQDDGDRARQADGAEHYHRAGHEYTYAEIFPLVGRTVLETGHILFGLGIVQNGYGDTAKVKALLPSEFESGEKMLLKEAKAWLPRLPFEKLDLLIVDEMGKNINGAGMDPHVIGRPTIQKPAEKPHIRHLFVRDLTPESEGNAIGIGFADITTWRLVRKIDYAAMYMNGITSSDTHDSKVPMAFDADRDAIQTALKMNGLTPPERARVARIKNTLLLTEIDASESMLVEVKAHERLTQVTDPAPFNFDATGNLLPF